MDIRSAEAVIRHAGTEKVKLRSSDGGELMEVSALERVGNQLVIRGKVFGSMPLDARLDPDAVRAAFRLLTPGLIWFLLTMPFRRNS